MELEKQITAITVTHNTKDLFERCYNAFRKAHPTMNLIIVDGSDQSDPCFHYVISLADQYTRVFHSSNNIGHGNGLVFAIEKVKTPFILIFDSDTEILESPVQKMLDMMEEDTYGVGNIEKTGLDGFEYGCKPEHFKQESMRYLHPFFCLIQLKEYWKYLPFCHHGAPAVNTCLDIHKRGISEKVIKEFPIWHTAGKGHVWEGKPNQYVRHDTAGTRKMRRGKKQSEIEGEWDKVVERANVEGKVSVITLTGDRPLAFDFCTNWIKNQIFKPDQWIIVDDGEKPLNIPDLPFVDYYRRDPLDTDPVHTLVLNLEIALSKVKWDYIIFMEDDEYYSPEYINEMVKRLKNYDIVGIGRSRYYHISGRKYGVHENMGHASLAQTAIKKSLLDLAQRLTPGDPFYDLRLWKNFNGNLAERCVLPPNIKVKINNKSLIFDDFENPLYVGMKGFPGRKGIGSGHTSNQGWYKPDISDNILRKWIRNKNDLNRYLKEVPKETYNQIVSSPNRISNPQISIPRGRGHK